MRDLKSTLQRIFPLSNRQRQREIPDRGMWAVFVLLSYASTVGRKRKIGLTKQLEQVGENPQSIGGQQFGRGKERSQ